MSNRTEPNPQKLAPKWPICPTWCTNHAVGESAGDDGRHRAVARVSALGNLVIEQTPGAEPMLRLARHEGLELSMTDAFNLGQALINSTWDLLRAEEENELSTDCCVHEPCSTCVNTTIDPLEHPPAVEHLQQPSVSEFRCLDTGRTLRHIGLVVWNDSRCEWTVRAFNGATTADVRALLCQAAIDATTYPDPLDFMTSRHAPVDSTWFVKSCELGTKLIPEGDIIHVHRIAVPAKSSSDLADLARQTAQHITCGER